MRALEQVQAQFLQFILSGNSDIYEEVVHTKQVPVATRLAIYREAYRLRLIESLTITFPAVLAYLGTEAFEEVCTAYIEACPSTYRSIRWFGDELPEFLKNYYDKKYSFLAELAHFEWHMTLAFDAEDTRILSIADMAAVAPELWADMHFSLHPSIQRLHYHWNAVPLWSALINDKELPDLQNNSIATTWILWRTPDYIIQFYSVSEEEAWAMDALGQQYSFGQLCEGLCQWVNAEEVGMRAASYLKKWIQNGMVSELHL